MRRPLYLLPAALVLIDEIHNQHYPTEENPMEPLIRNGRAPLTRVDDRLIGHHVTVYRKDTRDSQPLASGPIVRVAPPLSTDWDELNGFMVSLPVGEFFARLIHHDAYLTPGAIDPTQEPPTVTLEHTLEGIDLRIAAMTAAAQINGDNPVDVAKQLYEFLTETPMGNTDTPDTLHPAGAIYHRLKMDLRQAIAAGLTMDQRIELIGIVNARTP